MVLCQNGNRFQLNQYPIFHQHVCKEFSDNHIIINYFYWVLLDNRKSCCFSNSMYKRIFINFFNKTNSKCITYFIGTANNLLSDQIQIR